MSHVFGCNQRTNIYGDCTCNEIQNRDALNRYADAVENMKRDQTEEIDRLRTRIADLEEAGRKLGAECRVMRNDYPDENWPHVTAVRNATNAHPTAAGFVKEAGDGH